MTYPLEHVLVTGATGYIGGRLVRYLADRSIAVTAVVRAGSAVDAVHRRVPELRVLQYRGDVCALIEYLRREPVQSAFHLAAISNSDHRPQQVRALIDANVRFGAEILEGVANSGCHCFVSTGTHWQHGRGDDRYAPTSLYAATKQAFQDVLEFYVQSGMIRAVALKLFDVYGPNDPRGRIIDLLLDAQASGQPIDLSPGEQELDLVHVDDVVAAYLHAALRLRESPLPRLDYAVGTGQRLRLRDLVRRIEEIGGASIKVRWGAKPYRRRQVMRPWLGPCLPGWTPRISLESGIREVLAARRAA